MLTIELFLIFVIVYAWFFVPSKSEVVTRVQLCEESRQLCEEPVAVAAQPMAMATVEELVISVEELEALLPVEESTPVIDAPNYQEMGVVELRKACSDRGLQWRRYSRQGGKKKATAISRDEMLRLLMA